MGGMTKEVEGYVRRGDCAWCVSVAFMPAFGLASHKGYSTPEHYKALVEFGPTPLHRLSFEPVRAHSLFPVEYDPQMSLFSLAEAI